MTRVLYIGSGTPWTGGAGYLVRQNLFLRALQEVADLHLAMFDTKPGERPPFACDFTPLPTPQRRPRSRFGSLLDDLLSPEPRMLRGHDLAPAHRAVTALKPDEFDAVFAFRIDFAYLAGVLHHPRLILDIDDPEHVRSFRRILATTGHEPDRRTRRDLLKLRQLEFDAVANAKLSFVCQEHDQRGWPRTPQVVPNCVDVVPDPPRSVTRPPRVLFVGNCAGGPQTPNVDAIAYFLSDIWPKVLYSVPDAEFRIVGASGDTVRKLAAGAENVHIAGFVDDLAGEYAQAAISVAPIRFGTGTRVKILEAFAHACPVLSTLPGAEGIAAVPGQEIELATAATDLVSRCIVLLKDDAQRERIGRGGYALARRLYDRRAQHPRIVQMLRDFFHEYPMQQRIGAPHHEATDNAHGSAVGPTAATPTTTFGGAQP
jgi:glycosyltransferase involved in cell wall biosynthesis